jgi:hypothetical protein
MILEARSSNCFSNHYVLKLDGRPHGEFRGRWFSEGVDIRLSSRRRLHLDKIAWTGSHFKLTDTADGRVLAEAFRSGLFTSAWRLRLSNGSAQLVSAGFFTTGFIVLQGGQTKAETNRSGMCDGGWNVKANGSLDETDLILVGLIYHTILKRRTAAAGAASS